MFPFRRNPSQPSKNREEPWLAASLRPENFIPGLVIGFLLGLFIDLTASNRSSSKGKSSFLSGKNQSVVSCGNGEELKMVLVVRQDLRMGSGKIAAQCAHAATGMYAEMLQSHRSLLRQWEQCGQPKIVLSCKNQQEMFKLGQGQFLPLGQGGKQILIWLLENCGYFKMDSHKGGSSKVPRMRGTPMIDWSGISVKS
ncbi:probable peptidyl-tRNA hydrolase 2 isoform X3 [Elaeis guineensis]|uniref:probable peptidyl-tRNA hydrolase 2 isoform X3 n=1 Tax=Elaeis guineensis var. tenera TaxID=51953 RepID=UPI003C6D2817